MYQCLATVPSNFDVSAPEGLEWMHDLVEVPKFFGIQVLVPGECYSGYHKRLLISATWPFGFVLLIVVASIGWEASRAAAALGARFLKEASCLEWQMLVTDGTRQALPVALVITFVLLPSTAYRIFRSLLCDSFGVDDNCGAESCATRRYLRDDLSFECDTDTYDSNYRTTIALVWVRSRPEPRHTEPSTVRFSACHARDAPCVQLWPIGVPVVYGLLLYFNRSAIVAIGT